MGREAAATGNDSSGGVDRSDQTHRASAANAPAEQLNYGPAAANNVTSDSYADTDEVVGPPPDPGVAA